MSVILCAIPRSGSSLLGSALYASGAVGLPAEWFWREDVEKNREAWGTGSPREYLERVLDDGTSPAGVFAMKVMWGYLDDLFFELRRLGEDYDSDDLTVLRSFFPNPRFIWIRRDDVVAQAASWAKAAQTGQWAAYFETSCEPAYDFEQIDALYHLVRVHDGAWRRWFAAHAIDPFEVKYEALAMNPAAIASETLALLGLDSAPGANLEPPPKLTKQADDLNAAWTARYRAERSV
jgi:LPS sulfotransferase NodH